MNPESQIDLSDFLTSLSNAGESNKKYDAIVYRYINREKLAKLKKIREALVTICVAAVFFLGIVIYNNVYIPARQYRQAKESYNEGEYKPALSMFYELGDYRESKAFVEKCMELIYAPEYEAGLQYMRNGQYEEAIEQFDHVSFFYSNTQYYQNVQELKSECDNAYKTIMYDDAIALMQSGNYTAAFEKLDKIKGFKDSDEWRTRCQKLLLLMPIRDAGVGSVVYFGRYEQENTGGKQDIAWLVLSKRENAALLISVYGLEQQPYNTKKENVTWATCTLREWLNGTFFRTAFSNLEQELIESTSIHADVYDEWDAIPGPDTVDKIFVLSAEEADQYFGLDEYRKCYPTPHASGSGNSSNNGCCLWWLRTPGPDNSHVTVVDLDGEISYTVVNGTDVSTRFLSGIYWHEMVRPAMWVNYALE